MVIGRLFRRKPTGIPNNGLGEPMDAINWLLESEGQIDLSPAPGEHVAFLRDWRDGDLSEWPEYIEWLKETYRD